MEVKSYKDLLEKLKHLLFYKYRYESRMQYLVNKECYSKDEKDKKEKRISACESLLKVQNDLINVILKQKYELATFPSKYIIPFLLQCINFFEEENYVFKKISLKEGNKKLKYYFIFPNSLLEDEEKIEKKLFIKTKPIFYINLCTNFRKKYLLIPEVDNFVSLDNFDFSEFCYINSILNNVYDKKLLNLDVKVEDVLLEELRCVKNTEEKTKKLEQ